MIPNILHYEIAQLMLKNRKHVLVEKPMAVTFEQSEELVLTAALSRRFNRTGHMWRYHKDVEFAREVVQRGVLVKLYRQSLIVSILGGNRAGVLQARIRR